MAGNANLIISISAKDQASGTMRKIRVNLSELEQASGDTGDAVGDLGNIFSSGLGKVAGGIAGFFAVGQLTQTVGELGKLGAAAERTQTSFATMAAGVGSSGDEMLAAMRTATAGTVSNSELMLAANRAIMLGVADNADEMSRLMAAAIERGRALGVSASQAVSDVITGIGRMSPQILDNLGIVGATKAIDDYAKSLGKTAEQLTDVERKQALVNVVLAGASSSGVVIDDAASSFERMDASVANLKENLGRLFAPTMAQVIGEVADRAGTLANNLDDLDKVTRVAAIDREIASLQRLIDARQELANLPLTDPNANQRFDPYPGQTPPEPSRPLDAELQTMKEQLAILQDRRAIEMGIAFDLAELQAQQEAYTRSVWDSVASWDAFKTQAQLATEATLAGSAQIVSAAQSGLNAIARSIAEVQGADAAVGWLRGANAQLEKQIQLWADAGYSIQEIIGVLLPQYLDNLGKIIDRAQAAFTATANIGKGAVQAEATAAGALRRIAARIDNITARASIASGVLARMGAVADAVAYASNPVRGVGVAQSKKPTDELADAMDRLNTKTQDYLDTALGGGGGGGISDVADQFNDLKSKVQSLIDQNTTLDVGLDPANFLPREDAINENARRLAAIMRDGLGNQEWMDEFKSEVPGIFDEIANSGDPQAAAARILQQFQAGMRPELLDKEQIKERVRQMILGDQSSADLANEIAQELSQELGVSLGQAQQAVSGFMGGPGATIPLDQAGPDGAQPAQNFVAKWTSTVNGLLSDFNSSGVLAGNAFGTGFMSVQGSYIDQWAAALVSIVTAGVLANMAAQASRTGAR